MIHIRAMEPSDTAVLVHWMLRVPLWQRYGFTVERGEAYFERGLAGNGVLLVADVPEQTAVGFAWLEPKGAFAHNAYLQMIGVHPDHMSKGIGAALMARVEDQVRSQSDQLFLLSSDFNTSAHQFYRRRGYTQVGQIPGYALPDVDELIFWKRLQPPNTG